MAPGAELGAALPLGRQKPLNFNRLLDVEPVPLAGGLVSIGRAAEIKQGQGHRQWAPQIQSLPSSEPINPIVSPCPVPTQAKAACQNT